ncbi:hypothetical protein QBC42DRAFT_279271 [Cladorrhinum samala]|uniref:Uncharacterized protein n=1 Tax=Cladorrhinum samala TaxID=585594 RepID=A0AAV9H9C5_9PEZI|nr:hypothetical protein QBC42DRAFT_279271 [Cladorrhinum samala]
MNSWYQIKDKYVTRAKLLALLDEQFGENWKTKKLPDGWAYEAPRELTQEEIDSISEKDDD